MPYAVVGSTDFVKKENGKMVRARRYPWGMVEGFVFRFLNILKFSLNTRRESLVQLLKLKDNQ